MKNDNLKNQYRVNGQIHAREVRVVGDGGTEVVPTRRALDMARQQGSDLVEISPNAEPPVCRIIDYSKFIYQQKKRQKEMKQKQVKVEVKEIRFDLRPMTTITNSSSSMPKSSFRKATRYVPMCSSAVVPYSSRSKARCCCCVSPMTWRNMPK